MFQIEVKDVGRPPYSFIVWNDNGLKEPAMFETKRDAETAAKIIAKLRSDSALEYVKVI